MPALITDNASIIELALAGILACAAVSWVLRALLGRLRAPRWVKAVILVVLAAVLVWWLLYHGFAILDASPWGQFGSPAM